LKIQKDQHTAIRAHFDLWRVNPQVTYADNWTGFGYLLQRIRCLVCPLIVFHGRQIEMRVVPNIILAHCCLLLNHLKASVILPGESHYWHTNCMKFLRQIDRWTTTARMLHLIYDKCVTQEWAFSNEIMADDAIHVAIFTAQRCPCPD